MLGGCLIALVLLITIVITVCILCILCAKWRKLASITIPREDLIYDSVLPTPTEEKMEMKENDAYGYIQSDEPRYETICPQLPPDSAYARLQRPQLMQAPMYASPEEPI